jgi:hypothetical protein
MGVVEVLVDADLHYLVVGEHLDILAGIRLLILDELQLLLAHVHHFLVTGELVVAHGSGLLPWARSAAATEATTTSLASWEKSAATTTTSEALVVAVAVGAGLVGIVSVFVVGLVVLCSVVEATTTTAPSEGTALVITLLEATSAPTATSNKSLLVVSLLEATTASEESAALASATSAATSASAERPVWVLVVVLALLVGLARELILVSSISVSS